MEWWKEETEWRMEQMRKYLVQMNIEIKRKHKPTMIERIICHIRFKQLKHLI